MRIGAHEVINAAETLQHKRRTEAAERYNRSGHHKRVAPGAFRIGEGTVARKPLFAQFGLDILAIGAEFEPLPKNLHLQLPQDRLVEIVQRLGDEHPTDTILAGHSDALRQQRTGARPVTGVVGMFTGKQVRFVEQHQRI
jgi:hypothetical protein